MTDPEDYEGNQWFLEIELDDLSSIDHVFRYYPKGNHEEMHRYTTFEADGWAQSM